MPKIKKLENCDREIVIKLSGDAKGLKSWNAWLRGLVAGTAALVALLVIALWKQTLPGRLVVAIFAAAGSGACGAVLLMRETVKLALQVAEHYNNEVDRVAESRKKLEGEVLTKRVSSSKRS